MNALLPTGVESYLKEAGFSATEMLLLRKLVEEDSLTIRELASKTGKSTGILDQAMKKLISKKIAQRNIINDQPRYSINSLDAVLRWVKDDMLERKTTLERRHENFESFIATLKVDRKRPDIEHFHGPDGIKQAYLKLLESGKELLTLTPILTLTEEDPFRLFRVEYFRKRQVRKIFQRILAPDSTLARRFRSRDPFEYRKTLLVPPSDLPLTFEKTIVGDTIACFNFQEQSACFLKYPDLANAERAHFEALWAKKLHAIDPTQPSIPVPTQIPLKTRIFSSIREFILSRKSIAAFAIFALISGALTFGLYQSNKALNLQRMRDRVIAIASTGALQFEPQDIETIRTPEDIQKPEYAKLIATLNMIRRSNPGIQYAYLMRETNDPATMAFIADADSLHPYEKKDLNGDGKIDEADEYVLPGTPYDVSKMDVLVEKKFETANANKQLYSDQWGSFVSGYAPIRDESNRIVGILGIDILASELNRLSAKSFTVVYFFAGFFFLFVFIRYCALNRSLLDECFCVLLKKKRIVCLWLVFLSLLTFGMIQIFQWYTHRLIVQETGERLMAIAVTAAGEFDPEDFKPLRFARDIKREEYQRIFRKLNEIRNLNHGIHFAYAVRPTKDPDFFEFIVDADQNYNLPLHSKIDINDQSPPSEENENVWPGVIYDDSQYHIFSHALKRPAATFIPGDQWGSAISGCAPIISNDGETVALICFDIDLDKF